MKQGKINLERELMRLCDRNRDGSFSTQAARRDILSQVARQLKDLGIYNLSPQGLKPKHVEALLKHWRDEGKSAGTIKNRMTHLRWWAEKVNKQNVIARDNSHYGIDRRKYVTNESKARDISPEMLDRVKDEYLRSSLELQKLFGLRREECIKFNPRFADQGDRIVLKASWTKGGKSREVPIRNQAQREALDRAHIVAKAGSLIPSDKKYVEQLYRYEGMVKQLGLDKLHGLRHAYAQQRYLEMTGRACPACGGKVSKELTVDEKALDREVRLTISRELGHEREEVTAVYLGR